MLQDRIKAINSYFVGIESYNDALIIRVRYPERWGVYNSNDDTIKVVKSEEAVNEYYYYGDVKDIDLDRIFDLIEETIQMNQDVIKKIELLKVKMNELKELFDTKTLDELNTLKFVTESPKATKGRKKYTKKVKTPQNEEKQPSEASEEVKSETTVINETVETSIKK